MSRATHSQATQAVTAGRPTATFADVDISSSLDARPRRTPNYEQEERAYGKLATEMVENPRNLLQKLVEVAVDLCHAHTAGVSLLEGNVFRWEAVAGVLASARGSTLPRGASPCGVCIDRDAVQLMHFADRCFPALVVEPRFVESLLIPLHRFDQPIGAVWVVSHTADRQFDREDERVLRILSRFAAAGWQMWQAYETANEAIRRRHDVLAALDRRGVERIAALEAANARLTRALAQRAALEQARANWMTTVMTAQEDERRQVASELIEELGQHLACLMLGLHELDAEPSAHRGNPVERLRTVVRDLERGMRRLAHDLRPTKLDSAGLSAALRTHVGEWSRQTGISARFRSRDCEARLSTLIESTMYRIVQEALANVAHHAQARSVSVALEHRQDNIVAIIDDDGALFDAEAGAPAGGFTRVGLIDIRERAALLGGTATIESSAATGTTVVVSLPLSDQPRVDE